MFRPLLAALSKGIRAKVVAYPADEALDLPDLAMLVARQLPSKKVVLLAESFSGLVALTLLMSSSARVAGVIFVGAFAEPPRPLLLRLAPIVSRAGRLMRSAPSFLLRQYCLGPQATASDLKLLREAIAAVSPGVLAQRLALVAQRHSFGESPADVPAWYIRPSEDRLVPASCVLWFQQRFSECKLEEIRGPHFVLQANPRESARVITAIVQRGGETA